MIMPTKDRECIFQFTLNTDQNYFSGNFGTVESIDGACPQHSTVGIVVGYDCKLPVSFLRSQ
jgi:hypothetical protein